MKKRILSVIVAALLILSLLPNAFAASDFASEVPASIDATKTQFEYVFNKGNTDAPSADISSVSSYSNVTTGDAWKFANQSGMENYSFNGANGITLRTNVADMGNGANVVLALYVPKAGEYTFEYSSITRDNSGSLDIYFAKCPADFTANSAGANLPFGNSDKIADDLSFYVGGVNVRDYIALDKVVEVPEAGTYLVAFTDFKTVSGADYSDARIRQEIKGIRLRETFAGEIPSNADVTKSRYEYQFGSDKVSTGSADVFLVDTYSKVTSGDAWKFANQSGMENYTFNGANGITLRTNVADMGNGANVVLALYVPKAGEYTFEYSSITRDNSGSLDIYFSKCPDTFAANSAGVTLPFAESDKIADDLSFYVGGVNVRDYIALDEVIEVPEAGTYLVAFTDFKTVSGADYSDARIRQEIKGIRLSETFAGEVPSNADATKSEYEYFFGTDRAVGGSANISVLTSYAMVQNTDPWKFANASGMTNTNFNGLNGLTLLTSETPVNTANLILALYVPRAGEYSVSLMTIDRPRSGKLDVYFGDCPDNLSVNSVGATLPFTVANKIADDISFYNTDTVNNTTYNRVIEKTVKISEAGTYLIAFTDFKKDENGSYSGAIQQEIKGIKLTRSEEPVLPENPNVEITGNSVSIGLTAIVNGVVSPEAKTLLSESTVTAGNVNSVTVGSTVTLKADETDTLKFLYWYNGNSGRIISDAKAYTFTAGTNTPVFAKYADVNEELTEYFSTAGQLVEESEGKFGAEPSHTIGDYYKLFKETASEAVHSAVNKIASVANFVCWTKDGKVVSYDETYTYTPWTGNEVVVEVAEGEKSDVPTVVLFENGNARMLELVNFDGIEIIEKGILFGGNLTVSSCAEKAISVESKNQFTASSDESTARAYVIYRDGAVIRVAYSK